MKKARGEVEPGRYLLNVEGDKYLVTKRTYMVYRIADAAFGLYFVVCLACVFLQMAMSFAFGSLILSVPGYLLTNFIILRRLKRLSPEEAAKYDAK